MSLADTSISADPKTLSRLRRKAHDDGIVRVKKSLVGFEFGLITVIELVTKRLKDLNNRQPPRKYISESERRAEFFRESFSVIHYALMKLVSMVFRN